MSYPSIVQKIREHRLLPEAISEGEARELIWEAVQTDLPDGIACLRGVAEEVKRNGNRVMKIGDPNTPEGKQVLRLLGTDIARSIMEEKFGIQFGYYNCHVVVGAREVRDLILTAREQVMLQNGILASADC